MPLNEIFSVLAEGALVTIQLVAMALPLATAMAFISGLLRLSEHRALRWLAAIYVEFFRGTSALIQLYWIYFVLPFFGISIDAITAGVVALGLNIGAYGSEVVRGGLLSVDRGQTEAAIALNFSPRQRLWRIIMPQALVGMMPPFGNLAIELVKATSLVSLITIADLTYRAKSLADMTLQVEEIFGLVLVFYFVMAQVLTLAIRALEKHLGKGMDRGGLA
ncbi:ectoine/hydroxyectoine ABC transporter permease subunit EhuC [Marinobacterium nitratireducens]|uniref:Ectoine/hydroxyectoine ABC transporter permease subunit EhuC n=1 Tax=Marinobacterium nitratireducens TaxID=518897 RepID=A0A917ZLA4_9GAMM|nr:ectoine/hydroxyectoine ABC transporter permease subunit EhuC [Marinobacterium nitratireducens]GGO85651.1 ectoine/hydroxyectoine ABC transporter permease subunit EhuC [Marinobacterium nitratireducens]